ncbi:hypothetical protein Tco_0273650 [Tanacetum coccineum]
MEDRIFFNQSKYINEMLKKFGLEDSKLTKTPMSMEIKLTKDDEADSVDSSKYRETNGPCYLHDRSRIRLRRKGMSTSTMDETSSHLLWHTPRLKTFLVKWDIKGAIDLSKNPVQHSRTKHIEIRHHFLRDNVQKGNISIEKVASEDNIADIFTKPLKREVFNYLRLGLGMMELIMDSDSSSSQK